MIDMGLEIRIAVLNETAEYLTERARSSLDADERHALAQQAMHCRAAAARLREGARADG
jgi:hypothetical protein